MPITINGSGTVTGISAGGLPDDCIVTADIAAGAVTQAKRSEQLTLGTAQASTSGTSIDFTGIPSWVKRITVMFSGVSTSGISYPLVQLGTSAGIATSGYNVTSVAIVSAPNTSSFSAGFAIRNGGNASDISSGHFVFTLLSGNTWIGSGNTKSSPTVNSVTAGDVTLSGTLDRIRITTVNGTDTFDAGSINIMFE